MEVVNETTVKMITFVVIEFTVMTITAVVHSITAEKAKVYIRDEKLAEPVDKASDILLVNAAIIELVTIIIGIFLYAVDRESLLPIQILLDITITVVSVVEFIADYTKSRLIKKYPGLTENTAS
jgi:hypothetical protein